ncbi:MAG TPA: coenzyme F420-0:L-glutamate ligase [Candidatus Saccharimonadales bacterium]|nr:coenzyme F420-0:L-glutamate ligase [Candidatus Saccharimonadales bacterium]
MIAQAVHTPKITAGSCTLEELLGQALQELPECSIVAVTSKIVSLCEGRVLPIAGTDLKQLIRDEAEWYMPSATPQHGYTTTLAHGMLTLNSGIDESNTGGVYVLWPADPQASANSIRRYLQKRFNLKEVAVIITDSVFLPMRWGAVGSCLAASGIAPMRSYKDETDLFGRPLLLSRTNIVDSLATTATLLMGEGAEQTPLAILSDVPNVMFQPDDPTAEELAARHTPPSEDMFGEMLTAVAWEEGGAHPRAKKDS